MLNGQRMNRLHFHTRSFLRLTTRLAIAILDEEHKILAGPEASWSMLRDLRQSLLRALAKLASPRRETLSLIEGKVYAATVAAALGAARDVGEEATAAELRRLVPPISRRISPGHPRSNAARVLVPLLLTRAGRLRRLVVAEAFSGPLREAC